MKKFMILFLAPVSFGEMMKASPEEMKKGMEPWNAWYDRLGDAFVDKGAPLAKGVHLTKNGVSEKVMDVAGYSVVQADSMEAVKRMLADHPHYLMPDTSIEVFELMSMM